jgi:hypothetical protein
MLPKPRQKKQKKRKKGQRTITGRAREENEDSGTGFPATRSEQKRAGALGGHAGDAESDEPGGLRWKHVEKISEGHNTEAAAEKRKTLTCPRVS